MPIQLLPARLANQIAAGEVVERPASVVKELVENSLDAGATRIELDIERGGHKRVRLRDNGCGISREELQLALSRHATSKIATLDDLESILSLGFRGEALASISSVSRLTLTSKPAEQEQAWQASCEGRDMAVTVNPAAHPDGTTIDVADLFYNTPARRKFLRTEKTEFQHIEEVVKRIALSHPQVSFTLKHNSKVVRRFAAVAKDKFSQRIAQVVGQKFIDNASHLTLDYQGMAIEAWLGDRQVMRSSNDCQYSFVNNRGMRDKLILHAIRQAYESAWGELEQPSFVFYLTISPKDVDVNVHPAKHEVRFQQSRLVHDFICKAVYDALIQDHGERTPTDSPLFDDSDVSHDYIRPLASVSSTQRSANVPTCDKSADLPVSAGANSAAGHYQPVSHSPAARSGGGGAGGRRAHTSGVSDAYQANYNQLMTPNSDTEGAQTHALNLIALNQRHRLVIDQDNAWLVDAADLQAGWWKTMLDFGRTSQPLLMPVAIDSTGVSESVVGLLNDLGFVVNRAAGKLRLQQVPAGCRHLPWVSLFAELVSLPATSAEELAQQIPLTASATDATLLTLTWQWFDGLSLTERWERVHEFGKLQPLSQLIKKWDEPDE
ncbi:DNA mismatch repair endonuclease MutL [Salinimonas lutimaris]|uniref:DNA mismatch repair endonuclease MutL n=1 Tax=Salinimonas lutimaris TaxID=914153 RepID=UPI0010BF8DC6|nr:DNA mismatch repair endonuclease MutL [Salinimonas lutimaris]